MIDSSNSTAPALSPLLMTPVGFLPLRMLRDPGGERIQVAATEVVVGRSSDAGLRLVDPDISRRHCRLEFSAGVWRVFDLASTNGVYLNGRRIHEAALIPGDRLRVGGAEFVVMHSSPTRSLKQPTAVTLRSIAEAIAG